MAEGEEGEIERVSYLAYKTGIEDFVASVPAKHHLQLEYVTVADVKSWLSAGALRTSARTANNKLKQLRVMFNDAMRAELIKTNPAALVKVLQVAPPVQLSKLKNSKRIASSQRNFPSIVFGRQRTTRRRCSRRAAGSLA